MYSPLTTKGLHAHQPCQRQTEDLKPSHYYDATSKPSATGCKQLTATMQDTAPVAHPGAVGSGGPEALFPASQALLYSSLSGRTESMGDQTADIGGYPAVCVRGQSPVEDHGRS